MSEYFSIFHSNLERVDSLCSIYTKLKNEWQDIINHWFTYNPTKKTKEELLSLSYGLLDLHPTFHEKLKKIRTH